MADACCDHDSHEPDAEDADEAPQRLTQVPALRAAALSGLLLTAGWAVERAGQASAGLVLTVAALLVGG